MQIELFPGYVKQQSHGTIENTLAGAIISNCGRYRYQLWRIWDDALPLVLFIMHNPSKADATQDDRTINRLVAFTKSWRTFGGFYVGNIFPYRATKPKVLKTLTEAELCPDENDQHLREMISKCHIHILAHGNLVAKDPGKLKAFKVAWSYLQLTKAGNPGHPLYLKGNLKPIPLNNENNQFNNEQI